MPACYLFLDFDGVLHPKEEGPDTYFADLPRLEAVLRDHPNVLVVISSSWRHVRPLHALRLIFSADLRHRVVGVTPDVPPTAGGTERSTRHREVDAWLAVHASSDAPWIALEDVIHLYDAGAPLIVTPNGFGAAQAAELREALRDPIDFATRRSNSR